MAEPFETELARVVDRVVRELTHEITALILRRLGVSAPAGVSRAGSGSRELRGRPPATTARAAARPGRPAAAPKPARATRRARASSEEKAVLLAQIERALSRAGMGLGEIERETGLPRATIASALKVLKDEGRVFMGGNRRFARYATTQEAADRASVEARRGAAA
jgi:hypothetical protein